MDAEQKKIKNIGAFLKSYRSEPGAEREMDTEGLLTVIPSENPVPIVSLRKESGLDLITLGGMLSKMEKSGLVEIKIVDDEDCVQLTKLGRSFRMMSQ